VDGINRTKDILLSGVSILANSGTKLNGQYINQITTDQLVAGSAKIGGALIDGNTLTVPSANITGQLTAAQINATNLQVSAANVTGQLSAGQINATYLQVSAANIKGTFW
jgi:hypothetical protein